jgi:hypothetical protein
MEESLCVKPVTGEVLVHGIVRPAVDEKERRLTTWLLLQ